MARRAKFDPNAEIAPKAYKVLGSTDDVTECDLCGRQELKSTVALQPLDPDGGPSGEPVYFGVDCAARAAGWTQKDVVKAAGAADRAREKAEADRRNAIDRFVWNYPGYSRANDARNAESSKAFEQNLPFAVRRTLPAYVAHVELERVARAAAEAAIPPVDVVPKRRKE